MRCVSPWYNRTGWLGVKRQLTYLLTYFRTSLYTPSRRFRSSADTRVFRIPSFRTKPCCQRSFSYQAPLIWNQLHVSVRHSTSVNSFKSSWKTFLFLKTFSSVPFPWYTTVCMCVCVLFIPGGGGGMGVHSCCMRKIMKICGFTECVCA